MPRIFVIIAQKDTSRFLGNHTTSNKRHVFESAVKSIHHFLQNLIIMIEGAENILLMFFLLCY